MKLDNINQNNIKLGYSRNTNNSFETAVPTSFKQRDKVKVNDDDDICGEDDFEDIDVNKELETMSKLLNMFNSFAPFKNVPDTRKVPNTSNI